jgi:hypothetical protein
MTRRWSYLTGAVGAAALAACTPDRPASPTATPAPAPSAAPSLSAGAGGVSGANFTTTNPSIDRPKAGSSPKLCLHGQDPQAGANNCNIYGAKSYVWLNGGPLSAGLESGTYFWAVLEPGGQPTPNDGAAKNLSDDTDPYTNRTFTWNKQASAISYAGTHTYDPATQRLRVGVNPPLVSGGPPWFADTPNRGGVYILAICRISSPSQYPVNPRDCKYDAFKVDDRPGNPTAIITVEPDDVNEVGAPHTFTVTLKAAGGRAPYSFAIKPEASGGSITSSTCAAPTIIQDGFAATCTATVNSSAVGKVSLKASGTVTDAQGRTAAAATGPDALPSSDDGQKFYVDAKIEITPQSATNKVGDPHEFTITMTAFPGSATPTTFGPIGVSVSPAATVVSNSCASPAVSGNVATCKYVINSAAPAVYTATATGTATMGADQDEDATNGLGATVTRSTNGSTTPSGLGNSGPAVKTYASLRISLSPLTATNGITEPHKVTALVEQHDGQTGWKAAPSAKVDFAMAGSNGATPAPTSASCTTGADGKCDATFVSNTAGTVTTSATTTYTVAGLAITAATNTAANTAAGGSGNALKYYVTGQISWNKVDEEGLLLGGAEFMAERIADRFGAAINPASPTYTGITDCMSAPCAPGAGKDQDAAKGKFRLEGLALGTWRVTETKAPANYTMQTAPQTITIGLPPHNSASAAANFVNVGKYAGCTPGFWKQEQHFGYWKDSPFRPVDPKSLVSGAFSAFNGQGGYSPSLTMIAALDLDNSTGVGQLLRHGVAALLNAHSAGVFYGFQDDPQNIQNAVNAALASGSQSQIDALHLKLQKYNELGCTLSGQRFW